MIDFIDSSKSPSNRAIWPALALGVALSNVAPLWSIAPLTRLLAMAFARAYGRSDVVDTTLLCPRWHALVVLPAISVASLWLRLDRSGALHTSLITLTVLTAIGSLCTALHLADPRNGAPPEMWSFASGFVAVAAALLGAIAFVATRIALFPFILAALVVGTTVGGTSGPLIVAMFTTSMLAFCFGHPAAEPAVLVIVLLLWCGMHGVLTMRAQRRPIWFALGCAAAIVYAGRASFTTQSHVAMLQKIEHLQGTNATFNADLRAFVRNNEADVRAALTTAARWRTHFTFATSMRSPSSSIAESMLRRVPSLWRFVSIGLLGAFDGVPDADRRAASMLRQFFGDAQERATNSGPLPEPCRTHGRRTAAEHRVHLRSQTLFLNESSHSATLEIYEVYDNVGYCNSDEIRYTFRVPDGAQVTNLFLGSSSDRSKRMASTIEPSALAERFYLEETRLFRDPALLELTAPQTYRLRVAPLERHVQTHVWIEMALLGTADDAWTLPTMLERRHLFWSQDTTRRACVRPLGADHKTGVADVIVPGDSQANARIAAAWRSVQQMTRESTAVDDQCDVALLDRQQLEIDNDGAQNDAHIDAPDQWFGGKRTIRRSKQSQSAGRAPVAVALAALANSTVHGTVLVSQRAAASLDARRIAIAIDRSAAMRVHGAQVHELLEGALEAGAYADVLLLASASRTEPPLVVPLTEVLSSSALEDTFGAHELHDSIQQSDWITSLVGTHYEAMLLVTERGASDGDSGESTQAASPLFKNDSMPAWNAVASSTPLLLHFVDGHRPLDMRQTALKRVHAITTASDTKSVLAQLGAIATKRDAFGNIEMRLVAETSETLQNPAESLKALAGAYVLHLQRLQIDAMEQFRVAESIGVVTRVASRIAPFWEFQRDRLHEMRDVAMQSYVANSHSNGHQHQPLALFETSSTGTRTSACVGLAFAMILWIVTKIIFIPLE